MRIRLALHPLQLPLIHRLPIGPTPLRLQHLDPAVLLLLGLLVKLARKHLHLLREIAPKVRRVDDHVVDLAARAQLHDRPVDVLAARALRLPPVAHVLPAAREEEVVLCAEVLVGAGDCDAAHDGGAELEDGVCGRGEHGDGEAEEAEARDAAVGVHEEADVGVCLLCDAGEGPGVALRGSALLLVEDGFPAGEIVLLHGLLVRRRRYEAALHRDLGRVVPVEEGGVDFYAGDAARGDAQAEHHPVGGLGVVAAGFPAIVPGAGVGEDARFADGGCGCDEVLCGGEPLVGGGEDF